MAKDRRNPAGRGRKRSRDRDGHISALPGEKKWTEYHKGRRVAVEPAPRMRIHGERRKQALKRGALAMLGLLVLVGAVAGAWALTFVRDMESRMRTSDGEAVGEALTDARPQEPFTVLLLGSDKRPDEEKARVDTIIVARVDPKTKEVRMVSIPRDTRVQLPGHHTDKMNAASYYGGIPLVIDTVEEFLGVPVNHYMMVDFRGFQEVVDAMGGVWVDVEVEIDDRKAASHGSRRATHIEPGYQLLDGEHALTYVRSRDFPDADFTRMKHQQTFFKALARQSTELSNVFKMPSMIRAMAEHTETDMSATKILRLVQAMGGIGEENVQTATITGEWVSPYVVPDETVKQHLSEALRTGADIETTETVSAADAIEPSSTSVTVRNGAGIGGVAGEVAERLRARDFNVTDVGNADRFVYDSTLVVYKDQESKARSVAKALGVSRVVESRGMYAFSTDVLVVVGKDWSTIRPEPTASAYLR